MQNVSPLSKHPFGKEAQDTIKEFENQSCCIPMDISVLWISRCCQNMLRMLSSKTRERKLYKSTLPFAMFALLFAACTLQATAVEPPPIIPTASTIDAVETQVGAQPTQTPPVISQPTVPPPTLTAAGGLLYFWPASLSPEMSVNRTRSFSGDGGYSIEFTNDQTGASTALRAGMEADRYPYCEGQTTPYQIRGVEGCYYLGTGAGAGLEWRENGVHYSVGGIGNSLTAVVQFATNLGVLDYQTWQQKLSNAADLEPYEQTSVSPIRTRIEFIPGTTSNTSAYRELASGNSDEYILGAMAGQELTVNVAPYTFADSENFVLNISGIDGSVLASETDPTHFWTGILPATQDYVIRVANHGNTAPYQLKVNIPWRIRLTAGATSTILQGRLVTGEDSNMYLLQARAGQTMTVTTTSANSNACLSISARMTDGSHVPLVISTGQPTTTWSAILPTGPEYSQDYSISVSLCPDAPAMDTLYTLFVDIADN
jgi:hypothetical protein